MLYGELAVISGTANLPLAERICQQLDVKLRGVDIIRFPNENIFSQLHHSVRSDDVFVIQPTCSPVNENIMELLILIDMLKRGSAGRITAVVPYYAYGRSDKKDMPRVPITARLVADMIQVAGADRFITLDLHAGQIQGFFSICVDEMSAFPILSQYFLKKYLKGKLGEIVVAAPDIGSVRQARDLAQVLNVPLVVIEKRRSKTGVKQFNIIGDVKKKNVVILDDEIDTAGTVSKGAKFLRAKGARELYVAATHAVFSPPALERLREADFKKIVVTDTVPIPEEKMLPNIKILSVSALLASVIRCIHEGHSVGNLVDNMFKVGIPN